MVRVLRDFLTVRLAAFAVVAGVLVQAALGLPLTLRMAAFDVPVCSAAHPPRGSETPAVPAHDHAHCLLCQASTAPPLIPAVARLQPPRVIPAELASAAVSSQLAGRVTTGFSSRAPPSLA